MIMSALTRLPTAVTEGNKAKVVIILETASGEISKIESGTDILNNHFKPQ